MSSSIISLVFILAAVASAQTDLASLRNKIPQCAQSAMVSAVFNSGCGLTDAKCLCTNKSFKDTIQTVVLSKCNSADQLTVGQISIDLCKSVGITLDLPPPPDSQPSAAPQQEAPKAAPEPTPTPTPTPTPEPVAQPQQPAAKVEQPKQVEPAPTSRSEAPAPVSSPPPVVHEAAIQPAAITPKVEAAAPKVEAASPKQEPAQAQEPKVSSAKHAVAVAPVHTTPSSSSPPFTSSTAVQADSSARFSKPHHQPNKVPYPTHKPHHHNGAKTGFATGSASRYHTRPVRLISSFRTVYAVTSCSTPSQSSATPAVKPLEPEQAPEKGSTKSSPSEGTAGGDSSMPSGESPKGDSPKGESPKGDAPKGDSPKADSAEAGSPQEGSPHGDSSKSKYSPISPSSPSKESSSTPNSPEQGSSSPSSSSPTSPEQDSSSPSSSSLPFSPQEKSSTSPVSPVVAGAGENQSLPEDQSSTSTPEIAPTTIVASSPSSSATFASSASSPVAFLGAADRMRWSATLVAVVGVGMVGGMM